MADRREASPDSALTFQATQRTDHDHLAVDRQVLQDTEHAALVRRFREDLKADESLARRFNKSPEEWIALALFSKTDNLQESDPRKAFFEPLHVAWTVIAYDRFTPGSLFEGSAARIMSEYARKSPIRLSTPQVRLIDALADAANIDHPKRQTEIEIPDKYRDFDRWRSSQEYQNRLAKAKAGNK